ncbi:MAG TPA: M48 family metallopeptidase [Bacteroidales bacterium]|nr:M48 family metallopeptidase [Bacteroidales bacterium]
MKNLYLCLILLSLTTGTFSQGINYSLKGTVNKKIIDPSGSITIDEGRKVTINRLMNHPVYGYCYVVGDGIIISAGDLSKISLDNLMDRAQVWQRLRLEKGLDLYHLQNGYSYELRKDLEDESLDMLSNFQKNYGFYDDAFLNEYLHSILYKIHPITPGDGRPGNLDIKVINSSEPNSFSTSGGTVIITTGMLSTIMSEDELYAVIAHEVAHFALDHQVLNIIKETQRQKRAEFWSTVATAAVATAELYSAQKNESYGYYLPIGTLTSVTDILSTSVAALISQRLGAKYNNEQEREADKAAIEILTFLKKDPKALSAALTRLKEYYLLNGDMIALSSAGTQPSLNQRIADIGSVDINNYIDEKYNKIISFINSYNAIEEYNRSHFETALNLANRNINSGVSIEDDLVLKAICLRTLYDTQESNQEALKLINKAKTLDITPNVNIYKQEGITLLRLGKYYDAVIAFKVYLGKLESQEVKTDYITSEIEWSRKMIYKAALL